MKVSFRLLIVFTNTLWFDMVPDIPKYIYILYMGVYIRTNNIIIKIQVPIGNYLFWS